MRCIESTAGIGVEERECTGLDKLVDGLGIKPVRIGQDLGVNLQLALYNLLMVSMFGQAFKWKAQPIEVNNVVNNSHLLGRMFLPIIILELSTMSTFYG